MTRSTTIALAALAAVLILPAAAAAKGASRASVQGPQLKRAIVIPGDGESGGTPLGNIAEDSAFPSAVFGQDPSHPLRASQPKGDLGPRYLVSYVMPGPNQSSSILHQDLYPYAKAGAVSYVRPGQAFWGTYRTHGGWYIGGAALKEDLVAIGLPATAPDGGFSWPAGVLAGIAAAGAALVLLIMFTLRFRLRRRPQPVTA